MLLTDKLEIPHLVVAKQKVGIYIYIYIYIKA